MTIWAAVAHEQLPSVQVVNLMCRARAPHLAKLSVKVENIATARAFVQVVHVLSDDLYIERALQLDKREMTCIGFNRKQLLSALVVKSKHQERIALPCLWGGDILDAMLFPKPIGIAESTDAALGTYTCPREHRNLLCHATKV